MKRGSARIRGIQREEVELDLCTEIMHKQRLLLSRTPPEVDDLQGIHEQMVHR
jgi:hypothetical protein